MRVIPAAARDGVQEDGLSPRPTRPLHLPEVRLAEP